MLRLSQAETIEQRTLGSDELLLPLDLHVNPICCQFLLYLSYIVTSFCVFSLLILLVSHYCLPSTLLTHLLLLLYLTACLLSGKHSSICLFVSKRNQT